jgi:hypothetical protein
VVGRPAAAGVEREAIKGVLEALHDTDVRHLLRLISVPTLVLHRRGDNAVRIGAGRHPASHIAQGGRLAVGLGDVLKSNRGGRCCACRTLVPRRHAVPVGCCL